MRFLSIVLLFNIFLINSLSAQNKPAYVLYDKKGNKVSYEKMIRSFKKTDVILFGEFHDNPISHWLELEVTKDLHTLFKLNLGAEMIETDNQAVLSKYLHDSIDQVAFDTLARLWNNYKTDYKPLVDFAKDSGLNFIATNVPRRYAKMVNKGGFEALDTLSSSEKAWMAPLPFAFDPELPRYKFMLEMMGGHGSPNMVKAQALKDATMAHNIMLNIPAKKRWKKKSKDKFLHFNGAYHSDYFEGIMWHLLQMNSKLKIKTISTVMSSDPNKLNPEDIGKADFIICVDADMTRTY